MKHVRITVLRKVCHRDLIDRYENPIEHACDLQEGQIFLSDGWQKPEGMCESAWQTLSPFVMALAHGATDLYDGWMKNPASAMLSCNDGFRPVSFLVEALGEECPEKVGESAKGSATSRGRTPEAAVTPGGSRPDVSPDGTPEPEAETCGPKTKAHTPKN